MNPPGYRGRQLVAPWPVISCMSQFLAAPRRRPVDSAPRSPTVVDDERTVQTLLDALDDDDCRRILEATDEASLTASEIAEACDLALSTTYRKLDVLTEADLLSKGLRVRRSGQHSAEYERTVEDVMLTVSPTGLELRVTARESSEPAQLLA